MKPYFISSPSSGVPLRRWAIALILATPLLLTWGLPAHADFLETVRGIFTGDTGEGATGNARGGAIRDRHCGADDPIPNPAGQQGTVPSPDPSVVNNEQLILLVPNTGQTITTTAAVPEVFVYISPSSDSERPEQGLAPEPKASSHQTKIDLDDIDSVVDEGVQDQVEQIQQPELLLEFQFDGQTTYYSLPNEALIAKLQAPVGTTFDVGETSSLEVRLVCRRVDLSSLSDPATAESNYSTEAEAFIEVQRVEASDQLLAEMATYPAEEVYHAYLDNGLWLEMMTSLAAHPGSPEWTAVLQELAIPEVNPVPQSLTPDTSR